MSEVTHVVDCVLRVVEAGLMSCGSLSLSLALSLSLSLPMCGHAPVHAGVGAIVALSLCRVGVKSAAGDSAPCHGFRG